MNQPSRYSGIRIIMEDYTSAALHLPPNPSFQCREESKFNNNDKSITFICNLPSGHHLKFRTRLPSCGALHENEPSANSREEEEEEVPQWEQEKWNELYKAYIAFEKKRGDKAGIEDIVITGQRAGYEKRVTADPTDYDAWFEYAKMEQENEMTSSSSDNKVREVYERAIANVPPSMEEKQHWRRYVYLWIYYALYEEL